MVCASKEPSGEEQGREKFKFEPKSACLLQENKEKKKWVFAFRLENLIIFTSFD